MSLGSRRTGLRDFERGDGGPGISQCESRLAVGQAHGLVTGRDPEPERRRRAYLLPATKGLIAGHELTHQVRAIYVDLGGRCQRIEGVRLTTGRLQQTCSFDVRLGVFRVRSRRLAQFGDGFVGLLALHEQIRAQHMALRPTASLIGGELSSQLFGQRRREARAIEAAHPGQRLIDALPLRQQAKSVENRAKTRSLLHQGHGFRRQQQRGAAAFAHGSQRQVLLEREQGGRLVAGELRGQFGMGVAPPQGIVTLGFSFGEPLSNQRGARDADSWMA